MMDVGEIDGGFSATREPAVVGVELDGEAVLYHEELRTVCVLNPTATVVWNCLDGSSDLETLCEDLAEAFSVDVGSVRKDVLDIVREFGRQGLLEDVEPDPEVVAAYTLSSPDDPDDHGHSHD